MQRQLHEYVGDLSAQYMHIMFCDISIYVEVSFIDEPNAMCICWIVFQILMKWTTECDTYLYEQQSGIAASEFFREAFLSCVKQWLKFQTAT
jgi:hypothetical protein